MTKEVELEGNKLVTLQVFIAWITRYLEFYSILFLGILCFSFILSLLRVKLLAMGYGRYVFLACRMQPLNPGYFLTHFV